MRQVGICISVNFKAGKPGNFGTKANGIDKIVLMIKNHFLFFICFCIACTNRQDSEKTSNGSNGNDIFVPGSSLLKEKNQSALDIFLNSHADSINNSEIYGLPEFLKQTEFDYYNGAMWTSDHQPLALRKMIFDRVSDCAPLKAIVEESSLVYKKRPRNDYKMRVDFDTLSVYELAKKRIKDINCQ
jgi:hypothetical protein